MFMYMGSVEGVFKLKTVIVEGLIYEVVKNNI